MPEPASQLPNVGGVAKQATDIAKRVIPGFGLIEKPFPVLFWVVTHPAFLFIPPFVRVLIVLVPGPWAFMAWLPGFLAGKIFRKFPKTTAFELVASAFTTIMLVLAIQAVTLLFLCITPQGLGARLALRFAADTVISCDV